MQLVPAPILKRRWLAPRKALDSLSTDGWQQQARPRRISRLQVAMRLPPRSPLHLLPAACASAALEHLRRHSAQLLVLAMTGGGLALVLHHSQVDVVTEIAQRAAGRPEGVSLETWLACMAMSSLGRVLACGGFCWLVARRCDRRSDAADDILAVLHARQGVLRRFGQELLGALVARRDVGGEEGVGAGVLGLEAARMEDWKAWFDEQMEAQDLVLGKLTRPTANPTQRYLSLRLGLGPSDVVPTDWESQETDRERRKGRAGKWVNWGKREGATTAPTASAPPQAPHSVGGKAGRWAELQSGEEAGDLDKERARLERLLQQRSPSEQRERTWRHHQLFMSHLRELQARLDRIVGLPSSPQGRDASFGGGQGSGREGSGGEWEE